MVKVAFALALLVAATSASRKTFTQTYVTENFEAPDMHIYKPGKTEPGYLFFGTIQTHHAAPFIMTDENELIWAGPPSHPHNFKVQHFDGQHVLTYFTGAQDRFGHGYGKVDLVDNTYRKIESVCLKSTPGNNFVTPDEGKKPCYSDYHESYITDRGSILLTAFNVTNADLSSFGGPTDGWVFDWLFYEIDIKSKKILFRWSALDHVDLQTSHYRNQQNGGLTFDGQTFGDSRSNPWDFFHGNSVSPIPGGYLVNSRMTWSMYMVKAGTGNIEWTLEGQNGGDFQFTKPRPAFRWQHMPRFESTGPDHSKFRIHVFNNNNIQGAINVKRPSSGYLLDVDLNKKEVHVARHLRTHRNPIYADAQGSYQVLPNHHVLLGYGAQPIIAEFDKDNKLVYRAKFASTQPRGGHSYRAFRQHWKAMPHYPPKVARQGHNYFASWNGATDVDAWNFYAGDSKHSLKLVARHVAKRGFETKHAIPDGAHHYKFLMVEAITGGRGARNSTVKSV